MRLFTAVEIDRELAGALTRLIGDLRQRVEAEAPRSRLTWLPAERLHLTLQFIGEADAAAAERIRAALVPAVPIAPFDLSLKGVGTFPPRGAPRVIWAGVASGGNAVRIVAEEIGIRLMGAGVVLEARTYRPHLTLARVRDAAGLRASTVTEGLADRELGRTHVGAITLFESRLSPKGPTYVPLQSTALSPGTA